jgi:hypothetical protein
MSPLTTSVDHIVIRMSIAALTSWMPQRFSLSESVQINEHHQCTSREIQVTLPLPVLLRMLGCMYRYLLARSRVYSALPQRLDTHAYRPQAFSTALAARSCEARFQADEMKRSWS